MIENMKPMDLDKIGDKLEKTLDRSIKSLGTAFEEPGDRLNDLALRLDSLLILMQGEGTMGKLIRSDNLYQEIRATNQSLKELLEDIKANPQRYINVKVF
jgi:phospholipid/cholesterol/gamma-HCH transport system substrate-binding protein